MEVPVKKVYNLGTRKVVRFGKKGIVVLPEWAARELVGEKVLVVLYKLEDVR